MANFGGQNFTSFSGVNIKGTVVLRGAGGASGSESTLSFASDNDGGRAIRFPAKSGTMPISGTFTVNLPAISANSYTETAVTVAGIRREDALVTSIVNLGYTTVTQGTKTYPFIAGASPQDGYVYITFYNPTTTATVYSDMILAYMASR